VIGNRCETQVPSRSLAAGNLPVLCGHPVRLLGTTFGQNLADRDSSFLNSTPRLIPFSSPKAIPATGRGPLVTPLKVLSGEFFCGTKSEISHCPLFSGLLKVWWFLYVWRWFF